MQVMDAIMSESSRRNGHEGGAKRNQWNSTQKSSKMMDRSSGCREKVTSSSFSLSLYEFSISFFLLFWFFSFFFVNYCSLCCWYISAVSGSHCSRRLLINGSFRLSVIYNYVASVTLTCAKVRWECGNFRPLSARLSLARHYPFPYYFQSSSRAVPEQFFSSD